MVFQKKEKVPEIKLSDRPPFWTSHKEDVLSPDKKNTYVGGNSAWKDENFEGKSEEYYRLGNEGRPEKLINPEAYLNDSTAFWQMHEKKLVIVIVGCLVYLTFVVF